MRRLAASRLCNGMTMRLEINRLTATAVTVAMHALMSNARVADTQKA